MSEQRFSLAEICDATGLSKRNVRFYIEQGLAPPARGHGGGAYYTTEHVLLLTRIAELRAQRLTLEEIRATLTQEARPAVPDDAEHWTRVRLHPDLELHARDGSPEHIQALVRELRERAERWLHGADDE